MRSKIGRALWGIQLKSFQEAVAYANQKHKQFVKKVTEQIEAMQEYNRKLAAWIEFYRSNLDSMEESVELPPPPEHFATSAPLRFPEYRAFYKSFRFKKRMFGLHRKKVRVYFQEMESMQDSELEGLRDRFCQSSAEREKLLMEYSLLYGVPMHGETAAAGVEQAEEAPAAEPEDGTLRIGRDELDTIVENFREQWLAEEQQRLEEEIKNKLKREVLSGVEEPWVQEIREKVRQILIQEQKQLFWEEATVEPKDPVSNVIPIQQRLAVKKVAGKPQPQQRLTVGGTDFWGEDIEELLGQSNPVVYPEPSPSTAPIFHSEKPDSGIIQHPRSRTVESAASSAVTDHAYQLRKKYIVGKISGTDLRDAKGNVIIARNAVITEEVMNRAEREGKLAELILHMTIHRLGDA